MVAASCSCGSGIPVMRLKIAGKEREIVALPLILEESRKNNKSPDEVFDAVKVYNAIPADLESTYRDAIIRAYSAFIAPLEK